MAIAEGMADEKPAPEVVENNQMTSSMNARKTAYAANQHSMSIIGTDIGKAHIPTNIQQNTQYNPDINGLMSSPKNGPPARQGDLIPRSPLANRRIEHFSPNKSNVAHEENIMGLMNMGNQQS